MFNKCVVNVWLALAVGCCVGMSIEGPRHAVVTIEGNDITGKLLLEQASIRSPVKIRGTVYGLESGIQSLGVHAGSRLGSRCQSVGSPFVPSDLHDTAKPAGFLGTIKVRSKSFIFNHNIQ